jgi:hypothetical protein
MGAIESKTMVEEFSAEREMSKEYDITQWNSVYDKPKNYEYYAGERMTVIPAYFYPECVRGYLWGHY